MESCFPESTGNRLKNEGELASGVEFLVFAPKKYS